VDKDSGDKRIRERMRAVAGTSQAVQGSLEACHIISHHYKNKTPSNSTASSLSDTGSNRSQPMSQTEIPQTMSPQPMVPQPMFRQPMVRQPMVRQPMSPQIEIPQSVSPQIEIPQSVSPPLLTAEEERSGTHAWEALCMYAGAREKLCELLDGRLLQPARKHKMDAPYNALLLSPDMHTLFDELRGWFEREVLDYFLNL